MIRDHDIVTARPLIDMANYRSAQLCPRNGSPLAILNNYAMGMLVDIPDNEAPVTGDESGLSALERQLKERSMRRNDLNVEQHGVELASIAHDVARRLGNTISFARNVMSPLIRDTFTAANEAMRQAIRPSKLNLNIRPFEVSPVYSSELLDSLLTGRVEVRDDVHLMGGLIDDLTSDLTFDNFKATLVTGDSNFDVLVEALVDAVPEKERTMLLEGGFFDALNITPVYRDSDSGLDNHQALFCFLFIMGVRNGRLTTIDMGAMDAADKMLLSRALDKVAGNLSRHIRNLEGRYTRNEFVIKVNYHEVVVMASIYDDWLQNQGGSPEALLGAVHSLNGMPFQSTVVKALWENPVPYREVYDRESRTEVSNGRVLAARAVDTTVKNALYKHVTDAYKEDEAQRRVMQDRVLAMFDKDFRFRYGDCLDTFVMRAACTLLCDHNDAYEIIRTMSTYTKDNPGCGARQAALVAANKLLGQWLASMIVEAKHA